MKPLSFISLLAALFLSLAILPGTGALAHPEDEFCIDGDVMDPALCRELARLDSADPSGGTEGANYGGTRLREVSIDRPFFETVALYIRLGFVHILPKGYDHILFVLALFLASFRLRPLLIQVSAFTVAHTITLGLAAAGWISLPGSIIEPLIALSIAVVALENLVFKDMTRWRPFVVFGFGLFHGLGFAGVLSDLGLVKDQFLTSLVSFNVGVELGQLTIIALAFGLSLGLRRTVLATDESWRRYMVWPTSLIIAALGVFWFFSRIMFQ